MISFLFYTFKSKLPINTNFLENFLIFIKNFQKQEQCSHKDRLSGYLKLAFSRAVGLEFMFECFIC